MSTRTEREMQSGQPPIEAAEHRPLTALRGVAALLVILFHFAGFGPGGRYPAQAADVFQSIIIEGHIGVTIFFVLSGFLIASRYYDSLVNRRISLLNYGIKRFARIYPLYFVILALTLLLNANTQFPASAPLVNWTLMQGLFNQLKSTGVIPAWSLTVEAAFYCLAPLVFLSIFWLGKTPALASRSWVIPVMGALAVWTVALFALGHASGTLLRFAHVSKSWGGLLANSLVIDYYAIFGRFFDFACGIYCAFLFKSGRVTAIWQSRHGIALSTLLAGCSITGIVLSQYAMNRAGGIMNGGGTEIAGGFVFNYAVSVFSGLLILSLTEPRMIVSRILSIDFMVYLGRISYALYLIQFLVYKEIIEGLLTPAHWFYLPALYMIMSVASAVCYELVEKPCQAGILWLYKRASAASKRKSRY